MPNGAQRPPVLTAQPQAATRTGVTTGARDAGYVGPHSMVEQLGADRWKGLMGETLAAQDAASKLGSESGVEALLQKQGNAPNSAFDAALINGQGQKGFAQTSKSGAGLVDALGAANTNSQGQWSRLIGDIDKAKWDKKITEEALATNTANANAPGTGQPGAAPTVRPLGPGFNSGFDSYDDFKTKTGVGAGVHGLSQTLDPVSGFMNMLGSEGVYDGNTVSEGFRSGVVKGDLDNQNRMNAFKNIEKDYGPEAAKFLWETMTQGVWDGFGGKKSGAIYKILKDLIEGSIKNGSFKKPTLGSAGGATGSELQTAGYTTGEADQGTTDEEETARTNAYREGWGTEWDKQFREGNRKPVRS